MKLTPREYQKNIFDSVMKKGNTLVVLPTGLGKTLIALMLIEEKFNQGRCLFLAPTKPLVEQHYNSIIENLEDKKDYVTIVTGAITPKKRKELYKKSIVVATPQTIRNDIKNKILEPNFSLVIFDEGHRAVGDYAYTQIAEHVKDHALIVALTASPGGQKKRIEEVLNKLFIQNIELRTSEDKDVKPYTHETEIHWQMVNLPSQYLLIKKDLETLIKKYARVLSVWGFPPPLKSKTQFMLLRHRILKAPKKKRFAALVPYSILLNLLHMTELLETQSLETLQKYLEKLKEKSTRSAKILLNNPTIQRIPSISPKPHPKLTLLMDLTSRLEGKRAIIFAQYRDQVLHITESLKSKGFAAKAFMGKKDTFTRKMQEETIQEFRDKKFQFLCSSSIGEEGLDIPNVDVVIFYEPIPSEIRSIQRRGRTGRFAQGQIYILITRKSRDEYFYWASLNREKKMKSILSNITKPNNPQRRKPSQTKLNEFTLPKNE